METIRGNIVDIHEGAVFPGEVGIVHGRIASIRPWEGVVDHFIIPGFIDAHIHIESTMLAPAEFARAASVHGTVATVSDPHEITNVLGVDGVDYMIREAREAAIKIFYGAPPCVPATSFETSGARLDAEAVAGLLDREEIYYLSEVMNFPGVLAGDSDLLAKIAAARERGKPVDGHAPGLRSDAARAYASAGISTEHECTTLTEALDKIAAGMKILIREGSAARNYAALEPLLFRHPGRCMFCSDDLHPDSLALGHINLLVRRAVAAGLPPITALRIACWNPVEHYQLPVGTLRLGDPADFLVVGDLREFRVLQTYVRGNLVAENGASRLPFRAAPALNRFGAKPVEPADFRVPAPGPVAVRVIEVEDGQIVTGATEVELVPVDGELKQDLGRDVLKIAVVNRYGPSAPAVGFIRNFGLKHGAIASSVAHDSHNIVAVGASDDALCRAIDVIIAHCGGVCTVSEAAECVVPLPIAGLMSDASSADVAIGYAAVEELARQLGSPLRAPLMTLSFMALLVIPSLKLSDLGLFDGHAFQLTPLFRPSA